MDYLRHNGVEFSGKECVVIGRSDIVGKPLVNLLIEAGATVTCCNSKTKDIKKYTKTADIVISAIGKANFFDESYFGENQILVDVGINRDEEGKLCGDITKGAKELASLATPVPGGVGILTTNALMENVVRAYKWR
jgi:methylenetetrahydrofolate dehydrogenase (NADP+)/methenyltetrahydrofolate cyclohydrolase